jgi:putative addiction module component (TIGR02574 family)
MNTAVASVFDLSTAEKLQLIEDLWDDVAADPAALRELTESEMDELDRRKAELKSNPASGLSWEEVKRNIRSRYGR